MPIDPQQLSLMTDSEREEAFGPLLKLWGMPGEDARLQQQLAEVQALSQPSGTKYTHPVGAALGGIGDVLRGVTGGIRSHQLNSKMDANAAAMRDPQFFNNPMVRQLMLSKMLGGGQAAPQAPPAAASGAGDFGFGPFGRMG